MLAGCVAEPEPVETAPPFANEEEAFAAAEETYRAYVDALNEVDLSDPKTFEPVYAWTTGELNSTDRETLSGMYADGLTVSGVSAVAATAGVSYDRDAGSVALDACLDVSRVDVRDANNISVVDPARSPVQALEVMLEQRRNGLRVSQIRDRDSGLSCD